VKRVRVVVQGDVQGVGFRAATAHEARRLGAAGWVRNLSDGSVEVLAQGEVAAIDRLVTWLRRGPSLARVTAIDVDDAPAAAAFAGLSGDFAIRS
jgi:acylphosphatase